LALTALALTHVEDRRGYLDLLRDAMAAIDDPGARLARRGALRFCRPVEQVDPTVSGDLDRLTQLPGATNTVAPIAEEDLLRLRLYRVELLRVIGYDEQARGELRSLGSLIRTAGTVEQERKIALACDRLGIDGAEVLNEE